MKRNPNKNRNSKTEERERGNDKEGGRVRNAKNNPNKKSSTIIRKQKQNTMSKNVGKRVCSCLAQKAKYRHTSSQREMTWTQIQTLSPLTCALSRETQPFYHLMKWKTHTQTDWHLYLSILV